MSSPTLPPTMKALHVPSPGQPLQLTTLPTPSATPGSCIIRILAVHADDLTPRIVDGTAHFPYPPNFTPGAHAVGRVVAVGPDATTLTVGQLVMTEGFVRARDDPEGVQVLWGITSGFDEGGMRFMQENWAGGCLAEYARAPLENCYPLDEKRLCGAPEEGGLGYKVEELVQLAVLAVAMGGLRALDVKAGERVVVAPATGGFSGAAVQIAVALGARVVAVGRSREKLEKVQKVFAPGRVEVVVTTGDVEADAAALKQFGPVDAYLDLSPPEAKGSSHLRSCFLALRKYGWACMMGVIGQDVAVPYPALVMNSLTVKGLFMYEREDVRLLIKMVEAGVLNIGKEGGSEVVGKFKFEEADEAFALASKNRELGKLVAFVL